MIFCVLEPYVGAKLGDVGAMLELCWACSAMLGHLGAKLSQVGAKLSQVKAKFEPSWPSWAKLEPSWAKLGQVGPFEENVEEQLVFQVFLEDLDGGQKLGNTVRNC